MSATDSDGGTSASAREVWLAPAKINLWLAIGGLRDDGMHELDTGFQAIDLADRIEIARAPAGVQVACTVHGECAAGVPAGEDNLAARAALLIAARTGHDLRVSIAIEKRVPAGAGLGGASSDAAAVLLALGRRFAVPDPEHTLGDLAAELGADVPFFLMGGTQRARGIGDRLTPAEPPAERWGILVWPGVGVSTRQAYEWLDAASPTEGRSLPPPGRRGSRERLRARRDGPLSRGGPRVRGPRRGSRADGADERERERLVRAVRQGVRSRRRSRAGRRCARRTPRRAALAFRARRARRAAGAADPARPPHAPMMISRHERGLR